MQGAGDCHREPAQGSASQQSVMSAMDIDRLREHKGVIAGALGIGAAGLAAYFLYRRRSSKKVRSNGRFAGHALPEGAYDVVIVGSGPSGATAAYYLAKNGARVALLDKETFPRDKYCGDAVS